MRTPRANAHSRDKWLVLGHWLGLFLLYFWFISKPQAQQLVAGGIVGLVVALGLLVLRRRAAARFRVRASWIPGLLLRLLPQVIRDLGLLAKELWRALIGDPKPAGALNEIPFSCGGADAESAARRALVVAGVSVAPNSVAIMVDPADRSLLVHQLVRRPEAPGNREWPV